MIRSPFGSTFSYPFFAPDGGEEGGGDPPPASAVAPKATAAQPEPQTFSREYVHELGEEAKSLRQKAQGHEAARIEAEKKAKEAQEAADKRSQEAEQAAQKRAEEAEKKANDRVMRSELRALAVKEGIVDLDGLQFVDIGTLKLNDKGELEGGAEALKALKEAKPYLFAASTGTSHAGNPPPKKPDGPKRATDLSDEEWRAALKRIDAGQAPA